MTKNILYEEKIVSDTHQEYLSLINFYQNLKRPSVLVKYFNINIPASFREEDLESTYDYYGNSYISFDIYHNTPSQNTQTITNRTTDSKDLIGVHLEGSSNIIVYTINRPRINDLIVPKYPIEVQEIFRVKDFNLVSNAIHSNPSVFWYELDLEYAPIEHTLNLKINKEYYYDFSIEQNIEKDVYIKKLRLLDELENIFMRLKTYYSDRYDIYKLNNYVPMFVNEITHFMKKKFDVNYNRLFEKYKSPHGIFFIFDDYNFVDESTDKVNEENGSYLVYNMDTKENNYIDWDGTNFELDTIEEMLYVGDQLFNKLTELDNMSAV